MFTDKNPQKKRKRYWIGISVALLFVIVVVIGCSLKFDSTDLVVNECEYELSNERTVYIIEISGLHNKLIQWKINHSIQEETLKYLEDVEQSKYFEDKIWYTGVVGDRYFYIVNSFKFEGWVEDYFKLVYDLKTGKRVMLDDLFVINEEFAGIIQQYGKTHTYDLGEVLREYPGYEEWTISDIEKYLENTYVSQAEWNKWNEKVSYYKPDYLITEEYLYLTVPIPLEQLEEFLKVPKWW